MTTKDTVVEEFEKSNPRCVMEDGKLYYRKEDVNAALERAWEAGREDLRQFIRSHSSDEMPENGEPVISIKVRYLESTTPPNQETV